MIKKLVKKSFLYLPSLIAIIAVSLSWDFIKFKFENPNEIIGYYSIFKHSYLNDNVRYIIFVSLPLITYLLSIIYYKKIKLNIFKDILIFDNSQNLDKNIPLKFFFILLVAQIFLFISQNLNYNSIDLFHEGQAISGALNLKIKGTLWSESYIITSLFVDLLNANISWKLTNLQSLSSYRLFIDLLIFITSILSVYFIYQISSSLKSYQNYKIFTFIILSLFTLSMFENNTLSYRELPIFIFLIITYKLIIKKELNIINLGILGILPILSVLWSLDRGIFLIFAYIPLIFIFLINKKLRELSLIISFFLFTIFIFIAIIGFNEFNYFLINSTEILKSSDLLNGIIHPKPFSNEDGSTRATRSLLIIIINGILLINLLINDEEKLNKNIKIFFVVYYFLSITFYKIGITRSDGGHIKQGVSLNSILFIYFLLVNSFYLFEKKKFLKKTQNLFPILNILIVLIFIGLNTPKNFLNNSLNIFDRYKKFINTDDIEFLNNKERKLIKKLNSIASNEKCIQIFTYETAISYYLKKPSCTKYYHIMNMGPKKNQLDFIKELKESTSKFIIVGGTYKNIGNMKGRNLIELSPNERFPYIKNFINKNYKEYEKFEEWSILIKIR